MKEISRLAIIDPVGQKAGMDYYDIQLAKGLKKNWIDAEILSNFFFKSQGIKSENFFKNHEKSSIENKVNSIVGYIKSLISIKNKGYSIALYHLFSYSWLNLFVYTVSRILGVKVISIIHDVESLDNSDKNWIQDIILNKLVTYPVVHNEHSLNILKKKISIKNDTKVHVIRHGAFLDLAEDKKDKSEARKKLGLKADAKYLLFFGQIKQVKGLDLLLKAFSKIQEENTYLIIAGRPWRDDFNSYQSIIEQLEIEDKVIKDIRFITDEKRDLYFSAADSIILPYRKIFQSGVLLMAMSYGLPVIASDLAPNKEIIVNNENGYLFRSEDISDLCNQLKNFLNEDGEKHKTIGENAINTMMSSYSWDTIGLQYRRLLLN